MSKCVLCGRSFGSFGYNPNPLSNHGRCCKKCYTTKVIVSRSGQRNLLEFTKTKINGYKK